jgi:response regulator RpfG family c-di-GMP phosphodiesterase
MRLSSNDRRRVLLIDHDSMKQRMRAAALRNFEIEVQTACDVAEARRLWMGASYDLILLAAEENSEIALVVRDELKMRRPRQRIALLVGAPHYIRELGRKRVDPPVLEPRPVLNLALSTVPSQPSQWQVMMSRLLAAG